MKNKTVVLGSICSMMLLMSTIASAQLHTSFRRAAGSMSDASTVNRTMTNFDPIKANASSSRVKNKLEPDKYAQGEHTVFKRNDQNNVYKYETYKPHHTAGKTHFNPVKRFDGGKPNGMAGKPDVNKITKKPIPTPHVQGKNVGGGVRKPLKFEIPKGIKGPKGK